MKVVAIHPKKSDAPMPFVPAYRVEEGRLLVLSGCTALPLYHRHPHVPEEMGLPEDFREQCHRTFRNIQMVLRAAGADFRNVIKLARFLTNIDEQDVLNEVQAEYFAGHRPTSSTMEVRRLVVPGARLELEAMAVV